MAAPATTKRWWTLGVPLAVALVAVLAAAATATTAHGGEGGRGGSGSERGPAGAGPTAVEVSSDAPAHRSLDELVAAADTVVRGKVLGTERGRWFGDGADSPRIQSRLVTLRVDEVLAGADVSDTVLIEEEGWLDDGAPLVVDGAQPSRRGDRGIYFLVDGGDPQLGAYVILGAEGRYLTPDGTTLTGAEGDHPLVAALVSSDVDDLLDRLRRS